MDIRVSPSIIMRIRDFGESDLLVTFFSSDAGLLKGVAKGGRKSRRRFANCLDLFCLANVEYEPKSKGGLYFLNSCRLVEAFPGLRSDFSSFSLASYMIELTETLFPQGVADKRMFQLLQNSFLALNEGRKNDNARILFEAQSMGLGGYAIDFDKCCNCGRPYKGEGRAVFKRSRGGIACLRCEQESPLSPGLGPDSVKGFRVIQSAPWSTAEALRLTEGMICEIRPVLKLHIAYRIGPRLKSAAYLE
ncbi:MAG: DNA repair protein RecO [Thermodesulfobacteriota bacterium]|nr:DNA repair protein RecO [Thermodesulfobacteriota bacterium]